MKISVALCTYNGEKYIEEQLRSIINQTIKPDEIILCDDISKDNTINIAREVLEESDVNYYIKVNENNLGVTQNFQRAIELTKGDIIFLCDQDDIWVKNKIEIILKEFVADPAVVMIFTDAELINDRKENLKMSLWETLNFSKECLEEKTFINILLNRCVVTGATMAFRRHLFEKLKPFPDCWLHDGWLAINSSCYGTVKAINQPLIKYRQHEHNVIGASKLSLTGKVKQYLINIKKLEDIRSQRYNRYKKFLDFNSEVLGLKMKSNVRDCVAFWRDMERLKKSNLFYGCLIITINLFNGHYKKYYTGVVGAVRDIVYLIRKGIDRC